MPAPAHALPRRDGPSGLDRLLALVTDVRRGEGAMALLLLANIFLLLVAYSVIKTVREPLILLGGGAEVRSYAAAGQAVLLMGFVPLYSWCASRVRRDVLILGVTGAFVLCVELFAWAVSARVPFVGVAFFIWVGLFNVSLIAQFWSFANDLYSKEAGDRLFPIIVIGMTAGAPLGSLVSARLFRLGISPQTILQISAALLAASAMLYWRVGAMAGRRTPAAAAPLAAGDGFRLVARNPYLRLVAALVVLLNVVNTTGEYLMARLLSEHVRTLGVTLEHFDQQAYIGAFTGQYQFVVNLVALLLQIGVTSRLVKYRGLAGVLLALPLIALGGYAFVAAGAGFSVLRWIKTAENATDYSLMNTARQLLWLPTTREEKYKAKQAIDTFFVRGGDVVSALVVYAGASVLHVGVAAFAMSNLILTIAWLGVAWRMLRPSQRSPRRGLRPAAAVAAAAGLLVTTTPARAQESRAAQLAARRAEKAEVLHPYEPTPLERRLAQLEAIATADRPLFPVLGAEFDGSGFAAGAGFRTTVAARPVWGRATWSVSNAKEASAHANLFRPAAPIALRADASWTDVPSAPRYRGPQDGRRDFHYRAALAGLSGRVAVTGRLAVGGALHALATRAEDATSLVTPAYRRTQVFAEVDSRTSPSYTTRGGLYRLTWSTYHQVNGRAFSFVRTDADVRQFLPLLRDNWVIALRATASITDAAPGQSVPYALLPELGGSNALRGYAPWRFRDRDRVLLSAEYRWMAGPFVEMAAFVDAGGVAPAVDDLAWRRLHTSHGVGLALHTTRTTVARFELAHSPEGLCFTLAFSPSF
jgi:ATP:ADP antiporter, AAA family